LISLHGSVCLAVLTFVSASAGAAPPRDLDATVARVMQQFEVPGMAVAIVEDGRPIAARGYGVRKLGSPVPADEHTAFSIGSCSKAFTTAALALLVDEGRLSWDDIAMDRLPGFRLYDGHASLEMTIRDLLVHNSGLGLGAGDLLFFPPTSLTRAQIVQRLRYIPPARSFRSGYAYDNVLYIAAGQLVEQISGRPWEQFVEQRIFSPLRMLDSVTSAHTLRTENYAWPHGRTDGALRGDGNVRPLEAGPNRQKPENYAPAGSIMSSAADMAKWLSVQVNRGVISGGAARLYSDGVAEEMWTPRTLMSLSADPAPFPDVAPDFQAYALGWKVLSYRGHKVISHSGSVDGARAVVALLPQQRAAFAIMINSEDGGARWALYYRLLDHYLGLPHQDWVARFDSARREQMRKAIAQAQPPPSAEITDRPPSLALPKYAGRYRDTWYGFVAISPRGEGLQIRFEHTPSMVGALEHVASDTFRTRWADRSIEDAYVTFALKPDGTIDQLKMQPISPLADFSFDYQDLLLRPVALD
jgi:CubicO group peptidase (beta-lactamase class C family)